MQEFDDRIHQQTRRILDEAEFVRNRPANKKSGLVALLEDAYTQGAISSVMESDALRHPVLRHAALEYLRTTDETSYTFHHDERDECDAGQAAQRRYYSLVAKFLTEYVALSPEQRKAQFGALPPADMSVNEEKILAWLTSGFLEACDVAECLGNQSSYLVYNERFKPQE